MSRNPVENRPSTAQWLIRSREAAGFTNAEAFLAAVKKAEGAAPSYSTYAQWGIRRGHTPDGNHRPDRALPRGARGNIEAACSPRTAA